MNTPLRFEATTALRAQFPYTAVPHILFEGGEPAMQPVMDRAITDTTFRDGQQARIPFTSEQTLYLFELLHRLDAGAGVIRQCEFFLYTEQERAIAMRCRERGYRFPEITAWIRARAEDLQLVRDLEIGETGMLTSVSDLHINHKFGIDRTKAMNRYLQVVDEALAAGIRPRCHFEDVTRADIPGFVVPFAAALMERGRLAGIPVKIRLCDTMGVAVPWPAAVLPRGVPRLVRALIDDAGVPSECLEWHGHNDLFKGHVNAVTAWLYGCGAVNTTMLGLGERCGNSPLEGALIEHMALVDAHSPGERHPDLTVLNELAGYLRQECGVLIAPNYPLIGDEAFATRAGVHIDGLLKSPETYLSFDPHAVLGRSAEVIVSDRSGTAGIAWWVNNRLRAGMEPLAKTDPGIQAIYHALLDRYASGITADPSDQELGVLATRYLQDRSPLPLSAE